MNLFTEIEPTNMTAHCQLQTLEIYRVACFFTANILKAHIQYNNIKKLIKRHM